MGGGHRNDQIRCQNYNVEIEYEGIVETDIIVRYIFFLGHMKEMIENFNRYQIINESTGNVIKVIHRWRIFHHMTTDKLNYI